MSQHLFSQEDLDTIAKKGISMELIEVQLENFRKEFPPITLISPATIGDGIIRLTNERSKEYAEKYMGVQKDLTIIKFVPASGAASRMFKSLFEYLNREEDAGIDPDPDVLEFVEGINEMALEKDLEEALWQRGLDLGKLISEGGFREVVEAVLDEEGLNYGQLPKGLIKFHKYENECRTPVEEHLVEAAEYCRNSENAVHLHFTISPEHEEPFTNLVNKVQSTYEKRYDVKFSTGFSIQHPYTDTIAVDPGNNPFRNTDGSILYRPGGHGALLANLGDLDADIIFIKNIDNVCPDRMKPETYLYKKALAGILIDIRDKVFRYMRALDAGICKELEVIELFLEKELNLRLSEADKKLGRDEKQELLKQKLNRPIRVCGMVKNEGEPGGGPFWTLNRDASISLQIVESAQIDFSNPEQAVIAGSATHFNPVDLVCATRDHQGNPFKLDVFIDPETGLISSKSSDGRDLKAQELPGLWNGAMSDWNTLFIEVPAETFNPVKTVNDLLRPQHQA